MTAVVIAGGASDGDGSTAGALSARIVFPAAEVAVIEPPDQSVRRGWVDGSRPLLSGIQLEPCSRVGERLDAPIVALAGASTTCGVESGGRGLPARRGDAGATGAPPDVAVHVFYSPPGLDLREASVAKADGAGVADVSLIDGPAGRDGTGYPQTVQRSDPDDVVDGGHALGTIAGAPAIVQAQAGGQSRMATTADVGGDTLLVVIDRGGDPAALVAFAARCSA